MILSRASIPLRRATPPSSWKLASFATIITAALIPAALSSPLHAQQSLAPELKAKIDQAIQQQMTLTGVPSASVGIVQHGQVVYTAAFGQARLAPPLVATPQMHYAIGSISKQFTSACILLLAQDGKLTLDDPVSRWFPELTRAREVTLRNLLTHTSGYQDYAPQDYTIPAWTHPNQPLDTVHQWAGKPLDFDPGTRWQYSNTNFVLAGLIVEKASGMPFWTFLETRVLQPLHLQQVLNLDTDRDRLEPLGYMRNALGPLRPAILEAPGWYFADGELAMPVETLLRWDLSLIHRSLLQPASYDALQHNMLLADGTPTGYGLGLSVGTRDGHRYLAHTGEVGGFVAANVVFPDPADQSAIAVLTNQEASAAAGRIQRAIAPLILTAPASPATPAVSSATAAAESQAKTLLTTLQHGSIDRSLLTPDCSFYFSPQTLEDFRTSLAPLGAVTTVTQTSEQLRGGMTYRSLAATFSNGTIVNVSTYTTPAGLYEQFLVEGRN